MKIIRRAEKWNAIPGAFCKIFDAFIEILSLGQLSSGLYHYYVYRRTRHEIE